MTLVHLIRANNAAVRARRRRALALDVLVLTLHLAPAATILAVFSVATSRIL